MGSDRHDRPPIVAQEILDGLVERRLEVNRTTENRWRVLETRDSTLVRDVVYEDWHRVELAVRRFSGGTSAVKTTPGDRHQ